MATSHSLGCSRNDDYVAEVHDAAFDDWYGLDAPAESADLKDPQHSVKDRSNENAEPENSQTAEAAKVEEEVGSKTEVKELYATMNSACKCCTSWSDKKPFKEDTEKYEKARGDRDAFAIIRRQIPHGGDDGWKTDSIDINSPRIKYALTKVFANYPGVDAEAPDLSFSPPFVPFVHRWEELRSCLESEADAITREHLELLIQVMEPEIKEPFRVLRQFEKTGYIAFKWLELPFVPEDIVVAENDGEMIAGRLRDVRIVGLLREIQGIIGSDAKEECFFSLDIVDWNGERFGIRTLSCSILGFKGSRQLASLKICPLRIHPNHEQLKKTLIERGNAFEKLKGQHLRVYSGKAMSGNNIRLVNGRVIVDTGAYYTLQAGCPPDLEPLNPLGSLTSQVETGDDEATKDEDASKGNGTVTNDEYTIDDGNQSTQTLTETQKLLAFHKVRGFALQDKLWCEFFVSGMQEITWKVDAVEKLVLGEDEKKLLLALIMPELTRNSKQFDDFVPNKGRGIVILLCGPPGVGKTLTAETVAENVRRPLYRLAAGDLGTSVMMVEESLKETLERCAHWNAVLLIDEADVFLETRSTNNLERNELVSTFLRLLEYYQGIMILTTNRINALDSAFESRIDISLAYENLNKDNRAQVWRNFLYALDSETVDVKESEIEDLSQDAFNGRQIKSAVKTASILAAKEGVPLNTGHLKVVLNVRKRGMKLLNIEAI